MAEDLHTRPEEALERRLAADEARLAADEARLARDEAELEAEQVEVQENRIVAWFGVGLALVLVVAVTALVLGLIAVQDDVGSIRRAATDDSVATAALQDEAVTAEKLAPGAVTTDAVAGEAIGEAELAPNAVTGTHVAPDTLTGADIRERSLRTVPLAREAREARTAANATRLGGLPGRVYLSQVTDVRAATVTDARRVKGPLTARCPVGSRVISGGAAIRGAAAGAALVANAPDDVTGWTATARVASGKQRAWRLVVTAVCAAGGQ
jgi:hypothetical protein